MDQANSAIRWKKSSLRKTTPYNYGRIVTFVLIFLIYLLVTLYIFHHRITNIQTTYGLAGVDTDATIWYYWARLHYLKDGFTFSNSLLAYPFGYHFERLPLFNAIYEINLFFMQLLGGDWRSIVTVMNVSTLLTYPLSAFSTFILCYSLTKNIRTSFLGGIIFGSSYYFILMGRGSLAQNHVWVIPVYFLVVFKFLERKNKISLILSAVSLGLVFMVNAYLAFFSAIGTFIVVILMLLKRPVYKNVLVILLFIFLSGISTVLINYNFIKGQLFLFDKKDLEQAGRSSNIISQLKPFSDLYTPSNLSSMYHNKNPLARSDIFLSYTGIFTIFLSVLIVFRKRIIGVLLVCLIVYILLMVRADWLFLLHTIYFRYFGMFRAVSRMILPITLIVGLLCALVFAELHKMIDAALNRLNTSKAVSFYFEIIFTIAIVSLSVYAILEGRNNDPSWHAAADLSPIEKMYGPIKNNNEIKVIASYPSQITGGATKGFPWYPCLIAQVMHEKTLFDGVDPFNEKALETFQKVKDPTKSESLSILKELGVTTIIFYPNTVKFDEVLSKKADVLGSLMQNPKLKLIYQNSDPDKAEYVSSLELSKDFYVFDIL